MAHGEACYGEQPESRAPEKNRYGCPRWAQCCVPMVSRTAVLLRRCATLTLIRPLCAATVVHMMCRAIATKSYYRESVTDRYHPLGLPHGYVAEFLRHCSRPDNNSLGCSSFVAVSIAGQSVISS